MKYSGHFHESSGSIDESSMKVECCKTHLFLNNELSSNFQGSFRTILGSFWKIPGPFREFPEGGFPLPKPDYAPLGSRKEVPWADATRSLSPQTMRNSSWTIRCPNMEAFLSAIPCWICLSICPGVPQSAPASLNLSSICPRRPSICPQSVLNLSSICPQSGTPGQMSDKKASMFGHRGFPAGWRPSRR